MSLASGGWNRKCALIISHLQVASDQSNFPIALVWNGTSGNIPAEVYNSSSLSPKSDGSDIRFSSDIYGNTQLPFEIVTFTPNATVANARVEIYVKLTSISSSTDTTFYIWYNNSTASALSVTDTYGRNNVWTNGFVAIWHMNEGNAVDSTGNGNTGIDNSTGATTTVLGTARSFNASTPSYIAVAGRLGSPSVATLFALSNWTTSGTQGSEIFSIGDALILRNVNSGTAGRNGLYHYDSNWNTLSENYNPLNVGLVSNHYVCDPANLSQILYRNGANSVSSANNQALYYTGMGGGTRIGIHGNGSANFNYGGTIDEVRFSNVARSSTWITTEHNSTIGFATFITTGTSTTGNAFPIGWLRRCTIIINHTQVTGDQSDFPVVLYWDGTSGNIPAEVYNSSSLSPKSDGSDIRFSSDIYGNTQLPFEIVTFTPNATVANARVNVHVKLSSVSSVTDTVFYVWYKNSIASALPVIDTYGRNNVWTNGYIGVFHLAETSGSIATNSVGSNNGTYTGTGLPGTPVSSKGFLIQHFVNSNSNYVDLTNASVWNITGSITVHAIVSVDSFTAAWQAIIAKGDGAYRLHRNNANNYPSLDRSVSGGFTTATNTTVINSGYNQVAGTYNTSTGSYCYVNGAAGTLDTNTNTTTSTSDNLCVGRNTVSASRDWNGYIGEVRISTTARTATWLSTKYKALTVVAFLSVSSSVDLSSTGLELSYNF